MDSDRIRAAQFLRSLALRIASRVEELPFGAALFDERLPKVWDLNTILVDAVPAGLTGERLERIADALQGRAGLVHRQAIVADDRGGARLADELSPLGWQAERHLLMARRREPDRPAPAGTAVEMSSGWKREFARAFLHEDVAGVDGDTIEQLVARDDLLAAAGGRVFGANVDGEPAASCDLYAGGDVAQVEAVMTRPAYRGLGLARAVVLAAADAARADRRSLVFLVADEDDWVPVLYEKLGFDRIGRLWVLRRRPARDDAAGAARGRASARTRPSL